MLKTTMHPLQVFSTKSSSITLSSMKLKRMVHTLIFSHMCRIIRALSKLKNIILEILIKDNTTIHKKHNYNTKRSKNIILGSFRLHYNWCSSKSSHVLPVPEPVYEGYLSSSTQLYHVIEQQGEEDCPESQLAGYLKWLEEKKKKVEVEGDDKGIIIKEEEINENIDVLAEMFIANCHEKFRLEKQESDRRFQEMLARSCM